MARTLSSRPPHVVVAGAGAFGFCSALALADRGATVTLCDPAALGDNASGVAAGMLAPAFEAALDPPSVEHFSILSQARAVWPALAARLALPVDRSGALWAGPDAGAMEARLRACGAQARRLPGPEARAAVDGLAWEGEAVFTPEDWRIDPAEALIALRAAALGVGVRLTPTAVEAWKPGEARLANGERLAADRLVVAVGAARLDLAPELAALTPVKGQILRLHGGPSRGPTVRAPGVYVRPHAAGTIVGATMEAGRSDREVDPAMASGLATRAASLFPALAGVAYLAAAGVRASTNDGLPWVGPSAADGVLLAVGARRNGWLLAPAVGQVIGRWTFDEPDDDMARALSPTRGLSRP